jgi:acyl carrier protein
MPTNIQTKDDIYKSVVAILSETFKLDAADIKPEANLYTDLDIDSIDAIDLLVKLQKMTGRRMKPEAFKSARTVRDVVNAIDALLAEPAE